MRKRVNAVAWDGDWYVRYFDFDGSPLGSYVNEQGKIYINGQSWPVISGFATPERAARSLDAVKRMLDTGVGIKISAPGFDGFDPAKGGVTTYPPGAKENGGIFLHTNPWVIIAETLVGRGEQAYAYYSQINPAARNDDWTSSSASRTCIRRISWATSIPSLAWRATAGSPARPRGCSRPAWATFWASGRPMMGWKSIPVSRRLGTAFASAVSFAGRLMRLKCAIRTTSTRASNR